MRKYSGQKAIEGFLYRHSYLRSLTLLLRQKGLLIRVYEIDETQDKYKEMYGEDEISIIENPENYFECKVLIENDPWSPIGFYEAGTLTSGFLYTEDVRILPGQVFRIVRETDLGEIELSRRYQIKERASVGQTKVTDSRYAIEPLGD